MPETTGHRLSISYYKSQHHPGEEIIRQEMRREREGRKDWSWSVEGIAQILGHDATPMATMGCDEVHFLTDGQCWLSPRSFLVGQRVL